MAKIAVLLIIDSDDPILDPEKAFRLTRTVEGTEALRDAALRAVAQPSTRVVFITSEEEARMMCQAHDAALRLAHDGVGIPRPPPRYVAPPDRR